MLILIFNPDSTPRTQTNYDAVLSCADVRQCMAGGWSAWEQRCPTQDYKLPDGSVLQIGPEPVWASEVLVRPGGLPDLVDQTLHQCVHTGVFGVHTDRKVNVYVAGFGASTPGLPERIQENTLNPKHQHGS